MKTLPKICRWLSCVIYLSCMGAVQAQDNQAQSNQTQNAQHDHQTPIAPETAEPTSTSDAQHQAHSADPEPATSTSTSAIDHSSHAPVEATAVDSTEVDSTEVDPTEVDPTEIEQTGVEPSNLRDPHAYANGYSRTTGPYVLANAQHGHMLDAKNFTGIWMDRLEHVRHEEFDATELEGRLWRGNSYDRFMINGEAEYVGNSLERAEVDLLWSHAVSPFWNLRLGATHDLVEDIDRSWATISLRGLAPYWFDLETNIHIGKSGRTAFELEAEYDLLFTQRLVMQPRLDFKAYGESDPAAGRGKGASTLEAGMRLRYEFSRQFAPYIGVERAAVFGETAKLLPIGKDDRETHWVAGFRFWY